MSLNSLSTSPTCVPGSGAVRAEHGSAVTSLSGIFPRAVEHRASHNRERPRLIRVSDAMAGDAEGWVWVVCRLTSVRTAGEA